MSSKCIAIVIILDHVATPKTQILINLIAVTLEFKSEKLFEKVSGV